VEAAVGSRRQYPSLSAQCTRGTGSRARPCTSRVSVSIAQRDSGCTTVTRKASRESVGPTGEEKEGPGTCEKLVVVGCGALWNEYHMLVGAELGATA
jgi:hypothetical protein